ncbi:MAG: hypothetical protein ACRECG_07775, partial [Bradyrhizobium sp.]
IAHRRLMIRRLLGARAILEMDPDETGRRCRQVFQTKSHLAMALPSPELAQPYWHTSNSDASL